MFRTTLLFVILLAFGAAIVGCSGENKVDTKATRPGDNFSAADRKDKRGE